MQEGSGPARALDGTRHPILLGHAPETPLVLAIPFIIDGSWNTKGNFFHLLNPID